MRFCRILGLFLALWSGSSQADDTVSNEKPAIQDPSSKTLLTAGYHWMNKPTATFEYASIWPNGDGLVLFYDYYITQFAGENSSVYNILGAGYRYFFSESFYVKGRLGLDYRTLSYWQYRGSELVTDREFHERIIVEGWSLDAALEIGQEWRWDHFTFGISYYAHPITLAAVLTRVRHRASLDHKWKTSSYMDELSTPVGLRLFEINFGILL